MSRPLIAFSVADISALARTLRARLAQMDHAPSHVEMLNLLAQAAGHRNFQSLRAASELAQPSEAPPEPPPDAALLQRALRHFDAQGRLASWPAKETLRTLALWPLWARLEPGRDYSEPELNSVLKTLHGFEDHALLRRQLCDHGHLDRTPDGARYRRLERRPTPEGRELIHLLSPRWPASQEVR